MAENKTFQTVEMRINHVALYCIDLEGMKAFFERYFDAQSNERYHNPRTGLSTYILSFNEGSTRLEIMSHPNLQPIVPTLNYIGYAHLSFSVGRRERVDAQTRRLADDGYQVLSGPRVTGDGYYESTVLGPEDIQLEITE